MRREFSTLWTLLIILVMTPGIVELSENALHLVKQGHAAHAVEDGDHHGPVDDEHGCTPGMHLCGCHASMSYMASPMTSFDGPSQVSYLPIHDAALALTEFRLPLDRPPQS